MATYWDGDVPWITPKDMSLDKRQVLNQGMRSITPAGLRASSATLYPAGSVIVSSRAPIGYVAIAGREMAANQGCKIATPPDEIDSRYLYWFMRQAKSDLEARASGTTFKEISGKEFARTVLRWPALAEQERIVGLLEAYLSRLDAAQQSLDAVTVKSDLLALASSVSLFAHRSHVGLPLNFGDQLLTLPKGWRSCRLSEVASLVEYGSGSKTSEHAGSEMVPVLRMGNVKNGHLDLTRLKYLPVGHPDFPKLLLKPGDLLFNRTNSAAHVGKSAVFRGQLEAASFASYLIRVRFTEEVLPEWANIVINSPYGRAYVTSVVSQQVGQANVNGSKLKGFPMPVPPISTQRALIDEHEELLTGTRRFHKSARALEARHQALRRSLLAAAFSGRLSSHAGLGIARG